MIHYGQVEEVCTHPRSVLAAAYAAHPERLERKAPEAPVDALRHVVLHNARLDQLAQDSPFE